MKAILVYKSQRNILLIDDFFNFVYRIMTKNDFLID